MSPYNVSFENDEQRQQYADDAYDVRQAFCDSIVVSMASIGAAAAGCSGLLEMNDANLRSGKCIERHEWE